jgi:hypothetical protein
VLEPIVYNSRELTKREVDAYIDALYSIRTEETKKQKLK